MRFVTMFEALRDSGSLESNKRYCDRYETFDWFRDFEAKAHFDCEVRCRAPTRLEKCHHLRVIGPGFYLHRCTFDEWLPILASEAACGDAMGDLSASEKEAEVERARNLLLAAAASGRGGASAGSSLSQKAREEKQKLIKTGDTSSDNSSSDSSSDSSDERRRAEVESGSGQDGTRPDGVSAPVEKSKSSPAGASRSDHKAKKKKPDNPEDSSSDSSSSSSSSSAEGTRR